jgi:hypothetical protein
MDCVLYCDKSKCGGPYPSSASKTGRQQFRIFDLLISSSASVRKYRWDTEITPLTTVACLLAWSFVRHAEQRGSLLSGGRATSFAPFLTRSPRTLRSHCLITAVRFVAHQSLLRPPLRCCWLGSTVENRDPEGRTCQMDFIHCKNGRFRWKVERRRCEGRLGDACYRGMLSSQDCESVPRWDYILSKTSDI